MILIIRATTTLYKIIKYFFYVITILFELIVEYYLNKKKCQSLRDLIKSMKKFTVYDEMSYYTIADKPHSQSRNRNHGNRATCNYKQMWWSHHQWNLSLSLFSSMQYYPSLPFSRVISQTSTERYCIHFEGQQYHQLGCLRYPLGASDFRPQQNGQVHTISIINVHLSFTYECNQPWRPRHMCTSYYRFCSIHQSFTFLCYYAVCMYVCMNLYLSHISMLCT